MDYFATPVAEGMPNAGSYLGQLFDIGSSMTYGSGYQEQLDFIQSYYDVVDGVRVGLGWNQLAIGVQAGPSPP